MSRIHIVHVLLVALALCLAHISLASAQVMHNFSWKKKAAPSASSNSDASVKSGKARSWRKKPVAPAHERKPSNDADHGLKR